MRLVESITLSDEVIGLEYLQYMELFLDKSKRVDLTKYEIEKISKYFKQFPNFHTDFKFGQTTLSPVGSGFVVLNTNSLEIWNRSEKRIVISKLVDEWFLVHIRMSGINGGFFKVDQLHSLFKVFDENMVKIGRIDVEKVEKERIEKKRILKMRNNLISKIRIMSVEELDKWTKEIK